MAKVDHNPATQNLRGKIGNLLFRKTLRGFAAGFIPRPTEVPPSPAQQAIKQRFSKASLYAKRALGNDEARAMYNRIAEKDSLSRHAAAVRDWFRPPTVLEIILDGYNGQAGSVIEVLAKDDCEVQSLAVTIRRKSDGSLVEGGNAAYLDGVWAYQATAAAPLDEPLTIEVKAKDRPGNSGELSAEWTGGATP